MPGFGLPVPPLPKRQPERWLPCSPELRHPRCVPPPLPQARPSKFLPDEFIVVEQGMQALLASGLVQDGEAQVQVGGHRLWQGGTAGAPARARAGLGNSSGCGLAGGTVRGARAPRAQPVAPWRACAARRAQPRGCLPPTACTPDLAASQDEAAGLVVALLDPQPGERILDACAAPGGKTLFAAARMRGRGSILAMDAAASRLAALKETARRQGYSGCVRTLARDLRRYARAAATLAADAAGGGAGAAQEAPEEGGSGARQAYDWASPPFDRVLVDAPCSGTGVLAKRADLRWRRTPQQLEQVRATVPAAAPCRAAEP